MTDNGSQALAAPPLRDQIARGQCAGRAIIDTPELEALARLVAGTLGTTEELERCEDALRGIFLHETCSAIDPAQPVPGWMSAPPALLSEMVVPTLRLTADDPSVPAEVLADLTAADLAFVSYESAPTERFVPGPDGMIEPVERSPRERDPVPEGLRVILADAEGVETRAQRLLVGYLGGAGIIAGAATRAETRGRGHSIPFLLARLDAWFDPASGAPETAVPFLSLRPLLGAVLQRAVRGRIPATIREMRSKLHGAVSELHAALSGFDEAAAAHRTSVERIDRLEALLAAARRIDILTGSDEAPRRVRVRGLAPAAAEWLAKAARSGGITAELSSDVARLIADGGDEEGRRWSPSLANQLDDPGARVSARIPSTTLLKRHLIPAQLASVQKSREGKG